MKTIRHWYDGKKAFGYTTKFASYGKNFHNEYKLELKSFNWMPLLSIYTGRKPPIIKNLYLLSAVWCILFGFAIVMFFLLIPIYCYFSGAINFFRDGGYQDNVRYFCWINFVAVIVLSIMLVL